MHTNTEVAVTTGIGVPTLRVFNIDAGNLTEIFPLKAIFNISNCVALFILLLLPLGHLLYQSASSVLILSCLSYIYAQCNIDFDRNSL